MIRMALKPLVAACLLASLSTAPQAAPSPYSTLVVFGDSLSDAGQFPDPAGPAGSTSRFTNRVGPTYQNGSGEIFGPTAPMLLGKQLGIAPGDLAASTSPVNAQQGIADGNNWAVGGYRTDQIYDSITAANGSLIERDNTLLRSRDGYLVDRARQGLGADPNALYYITGGGNDFLQGRILNDVQAQQAAGRLVDSVQALQQAGARYIVVWLLPDLGLTPATFGGPLQPFASQLSGTFNAELTAQLSQAGANVIPLNIPLLLKEGMANPASFGLAGRPEPDRHLFQRQRLHHEPDLRDQRQHARPEQIAVQRQRAPDHHRPAPDRRLHLFAAVGALGADPAAGNGPRHPACLPG